MPSLLLLCFGWRHIRGSLLCDNSAISNHSGPSMSQAAQHLQHWLLTFFASLSYCMMNQHLLVATGNQVAAPANLSLEALSSCTACRECIFLWFTCQVEQWCSNAQHCITSTTTEMMAWPAHHQVMTAIDCVRMQGVVWVVMTHQW